MEVSRLKSLKITSDKVSDRYRLGDKFEYALKLKNNYAGHAVPTGDPERFFLVTFKLTNSDHQILKEDQHRIGEQWQWHPVAKKNE